VALVVGFSAGGVVGAAGATGAELPPQPLITKESNAIESKP
jgi:hypothetical protein